ncbi:MAG: hypothetical protein C5B56_11040 [Proteobacteria bacterium]|nr:MAG: hypothetical protein C5B56_11040 [Pseudomonadota bacterium]
MFVAALALALPAFAQSQSSSQQSTGDAVADAARKAREAKKNAPKPKKVYTEDDVSTVPSAPPAAQAAASGTSEATSQGQVPGHAREGAQAPQKAGDQEKTPEEKWRARFKAQHDRIAQAEKELAILQREAGKTLVQYYSDPQKALAEQYSRKDVNDKDTQIAAKQKEIEHLKQQLSDMEDELRKEGGDPGWAR